MSQHELGSLVRRLRKEHGLTQEQLAEGICSPVSISRIESGRQRPSKALLDALMDRLGLDGYQLFESSAGSAKRQAFDRLSQATWNAINHLDVDRGRVLLSDLRSSARETGSPGERQRVLELEAAALIRSQDSPEDCMRALELLEQGLRLSQPDIDVHDLEVRLLSSREAELLSLMVVALHGAGRPMDAIRLGERTLAALRRQGGLEGRQFVLCLSLMVNLANILEELGQAKEARTYLDLARDTSIKEDELGLMPFILAGTARLEFRAGDTTEAASTLRTVAAYLDLCEMHDYAHAIRAWMRHQGS